MMYPYIHAGAGKKGVKKLMGLFKSNKVAPASPSIGLLAPRTPKGGFSVQKSENSGLASSLVNGQEGRVLMSPNVAALTRMKGE
jgi:hypothetical protein